MASDPAAPHEGSCDEGACDHAAGSDAIAGTDRQGRYPGRLGFGSEAAWGANPSAASISTVASKRSPRNSPNGRASVLLLTALPAAAQIGAVTVRSPRPFGLFLGDRSHAPSSHEPSCGGPEEVAGKVVAVEAAGEAVGRPLLGTAA
jgi:hypothetical protein